MLVFIFMKYSIHIYNNKTGLVVQLHPETKNCPPVKKCGQFC